MNSIKDIEKSNSFSNAPHDILSEAIKALQNHLENNSGNGKAVIPKITSSNNPQQEFNPENFIASNNKDKTNIIRFIEQYLKNSIKLHHPCYMGHQLAPSAWPSAIADIINGAINNGSSLFEMGPSAAIVEKCVINWFLSKLPWSTKQSGGVLTSGGSLANLTCLLAARNHVDSNIWDTGYSKPMALLVPASHHYSISRAAGIMGIGTKSIFEIATDKFGRIIPEKLDLKITEIQKTHSIIALVGNAAATATGLYDRFEAIGSICSKHKIWFHIDGAHGASAIITPKYKKLLSGIEYADSLTWDAHKMLQTSSVCASALFKNKNSIDTAFKQQAEYFTPGNDTDLDAYNRTIECTKTPIGLKLMINLVGLGEDQLSQNIESLYELAKNAYQQICDNQNFECLVEPESNILCFRLKLKDNEFHRRIREKVIAKRDFYISQTTINEKYYFRLVFMNSSTSSHHIEQLLCEIENYASV